MLLHESVLVIEKQLSVSPINQAVGNLGYVVIKKYRSQAYLLLNALWMFSVLDDILVLAITLDTAFQDHSFLHLHNNWFEKTYMLNARYRGPTRWLVILSLTSY